MVGDWSWGAARLFHALEPKHPLAWLELSPRDDAILQANKLSDALRRALGGPLLGYDLPFGYGLNVLKRHLPLIGPLAFALSNAEHGQELAQGLLALENSRTLLHFSALPKHLSSTANVHLVTPETLRLTQKEALELAHGRLSAAATLELWEESRGAYESFIAALHTALSLPLPAYPSPNGWQVSPYAPERDAEGVFKLLLKRGGWFEALELAVEHFPMRVPEALRAAGEKPWTQGYQARLYPLLSNLPEALRRDETVLFWRLLAANTLGKEQEVMPDAEAFLGANEAPNLRALYAEARFSLGDAEGYVQVAQRAVKSEETPVTLYTHGRALGLTDPAAGLEPLEQSLRLAEARGESYFAAQVAGALSARLTTLGRYRAAVTWAEWGLKLYYQEGVVQDTTRLSLLNALAYARILLGKTAGLEATLREETEDLSGAQPSLARVLRSTLADLLLSQGKAEEALVIYRALWQENVRRERAGNLASYLVRALLEVGKVDEALDISAEALELTENLSTLRQERARLAHGMALSFAEPEQALRFLEHAFKDFQNPLSAVFLAQTGLHLARAHLLLGRAEQAKAVIEQVQAGIRTLGRDGLAYLAGPPTAFGEVFTLLTGDATPSLEVYFLGGIRVYLNGKALKLRLRLAELTMVLAMHPEGLMSEQLTLAVYGETGDPKLCQVEVGRLRKLFPVRNRPYALGIAVESDYQKVVAMMGSNRLLEAVTLYKGPLLPNSQAPEIVELRNYLEEALRQAALKAADPAVLWTLAEVLEDDLELWEAVLAALDSQSPRYVLAQAKVKTLSKKYYP